MLTVLASLAFVAAAFVAVATVAATWSQYRDVALGNIAALGRVGDEREFRVTLAAIARRPLLAGQAGMRRQPHRVAARGAVRTPARRAAA